MAASIKQNSDSAEGAREFPGVTSGKDYPVQGFSGGGVVIINDDAKFMHVSFADIDAGWTVADDAAKKPKQSAKSEDDNKTTT